MSVVPQLTIAGNNDLASETARHALASGLADPVYLWRDTRDPLPAPTPVIILADAGARAAFARTALENGMIAVTLPLADPDDGLRAAVEAGNLRQMSRLHGVPALSRLQGDARKGQEGRRYGIFAAHRLPRNHAGDVDHALRDLVVFVTSLGGGALEHVRATSANLGGESASWFVLARFTGGAIATIEVSAVLPESETADGEVLIEVTGSTGVLRAAPERQSVNVYGGNHVTRHRWYPDPVGPLLERAMALIKGDPAEEQAAAWQLLSTLEEAAGADSLVRPR